MRSSARITTALRMKKSACCSAIRTDACSRSYSWAPRPNAPVRNEFSGMAGVSTTGWRQMRVTAPTETFVAMM